MCEYCVYLKQSTENVQARSNLGAALARAGDYGAAIAEYRQALEKVPENPPVRLNLALAYYKTAQITEAADQLQKVVARQPANRQAGFLRAGCDLQLGENTKVIQRLS